MAGFIGYLIGYVVMRRFGRLVRRDTCIRAPAGIRAGFHLAAFRCTLFLWLRFHNSMYRNRRNRPESGIFGYIRCLVRSSLCNRRLTWLVSRGPLSARGSSPTKSSFTA